MRDGILPGGLVGHPAICVPNLKKIRPQGLLPARWVHLPVLIRQGRYATQQVQASQDRRKPLGATEALGL
jgi:hypothetical protein